MGKNIKTITLVLVIGAVLAGGTVLAQDNAGNSIVGVLKELVNKVEQLAENDHLVCYPIERNSNEEEVGIEYKNQLEGNKIVIGPAEYFCVPTDKLAVNDEPTEPGCFEVPPDVDPSSGACKSIAWINQHNLPQCCEAKAPGGLNCGGNSEWVIGTAAQPMCFVPGS